MKRNIAFLIVLCILFAIMPCCAAEASLLLSDDFETENALWYGGTYHTEENGQSYCFFNQIDCKESIALSANVVYSLSYSVRAAEASLNEMPSGRIFMEGSYPGIICHTTSVSVNWQRVEIRFIVPRTETYSLSFSMDYTSGNDSFYIDNITLHMISFTPTHVSIAGPRDIYISETDTLSYPYSTVLLDRHETPVYVPNGTIMFTEAIPSGISFLEDENILQVESGTLSGTAFTLEPVLVKGYESLENIPITVVASKQMLQNGSFDSHPMYDGWVRAEDSFQICTDKITGSYCAKVAMTQISDNAYMGEIKTTRSFYLRQDLMYVFRAKLRSEAGYTTRKIQASVSTPIQDSIHIYVSQIGGEEWTSVVAAFYVPHDGTYGLDFHFSAADARPVYVDAISVRTEPSAPSDVVFDAPAHVCLPENAPLSIPFACAARNQAGEILSERPVLSITPEDAGVYIEDDRLIVTPEASKSEYVIHASPLDYPDVKGQHSISISKDSIGDGSFEKTTPGHFWASAAPSMLNYVTAHDGRQPSDGRFLAKLTLNGAVSVLLADSVFNYEKGKSYVFETDICKIVPDIDTIVTVLVNAVGGDAFDDNLVIGQFPLSNDMQHVQKLFTPSMAITGRLMIAFNTPETYDMQTILLDNVRISPANVYATEVSVSGSPFVDKVLSGKYRFASNFGAVDASAYKWLISETRDGIYMPIDSQTTNTLSVTNDMDGKYIKFEVTPISLSGPVVGASVTSAPVHIGYSYSPGYVIDTTDEADMTDENEWGTETKPTSPSFGQEDLTSGGLQIVDIRRYAGETNWKFLDLSYHWAQDDIAIMSAAGIVNGRGDGFFVPQAKITRAEFAAILARAFSFAPTFYQGRFRDVKADSWYAGVIETVTKHEIAIGTSETTFSPDLPITREEMATMIMRAYRKTEAKAGTATYNYTDMASVSAWALQDVGEAQNLAILLGEPDGSFAPKRTATRAEAIVAVKRMLMVIIENLVG
ncbi:MAG: S-layer homology domain-containing protein [Clostridia bacterium]|nr:S-layer homology domain-containing protein [Clostridia bacterium]